MGFGLIVGFFLRKIENQPTTFPFVLLKCLGVKTPHQLCAKEPNGGETLPELALPSSLMLLGLGLAQSDQGRRV